MSVRLLDPAAVGPTSPRDRFAPRRPIVFVDLETTGLERGARIVSAALVREAPDGTVETFHALVNPGIPIPAGATAVHGITDADVADRPPFAAIAARVRDFIGDADLAGFNTSFDLPILRRELEAAGVPLDPADRRVVDVKALYHRLRPRTLSDAYREFVGGALDAAHDALADTLACRAVLRAMVERHPELGDDAEALGTPMKDPSWVDEDGKFVWAGKEAVFAFGKARGRTLREVASSDPGFLRWMLGKDFAPQVKAIVEDALRGTFPAPRGAAAPAATTDAG